METYSLSDIISKTLKEITDKPETYIKTIKFNNRKFMLHVYTNGMRILFWLDTMDGELYIDINKMLPNNMLLDAIWVEAGGLEEEIADSIDIFKKTDRTTKSGYNTYVLYEFDEGFDKFKYAHI